MKNAIKSNKIRGSAQGEECTLNVPGCCNYDNSTTVLAHYPSDLSGYKSTDFSAGYACSDCHDFIDGRNSSPIFKEDKEFFMRRSQVRTLHKLIEKGLVTYI